MRHLELSFPHCDCMNIGEETSLGDEMGLFSAIKKRRDQRLYEEALQIINPYVLIPQRGGVLWWRWVIVPESEAVGALPRHDGLPVIMTKEECAASNGGKLPDFWGEVQCAWRNETQKRTFYANHSERSERKEQSAYPTEEQMKEMWDALESGEDAAVLAVLKKRELERMLIEAGDSVSMPDGSEIDLPRAENRVTTTPKNPQKVTAKEYPTDEEMEECWKAYKSGGEDGILKFLQEQRRRREMDNSEPAKS